MMENLPAPGLLIRAQDNNCRTDTGMKELSRTVSSEALQSSNENGISTQTQSKRLPKISTEQQSTANKSFDSSTEIRLSFRRSHTCGSLFAKCGCSTPSPFTTILDDSTSTVISSDDLNYNGNVQSTANNEGDSVNSSTIRYSSHSESDKKTTKTKTSFSHPDTAFIFTDENKNPIKDSCIRNGGTTITTKGGKLQIKHPKRLSSPNIGNYALLDVAVHPEVLLKISAKNVTEKDTPAECQIPEIKNSRPILQCSDRASKSSDSENSVEILQDNIRSSSFSEVEIPYSLYDSQSDCDEIDAIVGNINGNLEYQKYTPQPVIQEHLDPAQRYFQESGILGPICSSSVSLIRKTSKIMQDPNFIEHIRKNSKLLRQGGIHKDELEYTRSLIPTLKLDEDRKEDKLKSLEEEVISLKDIIKTRDNEIYKLKREIHKLKSVLQQTTNHMPIADGDLLSSLQTLHGMAGQQCQESLGCPNVKFVKSDNNNCQYQHISSIVSTSDDIEPVISAMSNNYNCKQTSIPSGRSGSISPITCGPSKTNQLIAAPHVKKQGVSGESSDAANQQSNNVPIPKYKKDFRSKQLIKDAIMDNDFLKNIDSTQVRELVESMYSLEVAKGEYVIREGAAGAHLYVSAEGEFEVMKSGKILGVMGAGKAFGELAILYNCTRTASIRAVSNARVWVLDRRVFQQIMMRTGMQRIEENVNFLKSVPLLKNLSNDVLAKIADVLEVEFYPAGTYIIRQGASGDTFFLISQGTVKVTQRLSTSSEESEIRTLSRGDYFGEQALINEDKRTANIIAMPPGVECLTLDRESFTHLIGDLCELKEKTYGDESRVLAMKSSESSAEIFGSNVQQELLDVSLNDFELVATLGIGGFGRVELVKCYRENRVETYALKCLKKKHILDTRQEEHVFSERTIMLSCRTPFICRLYRTFRDEKYVYMLLEACMGGEVWTILRDRGCFDETTAQFIIGCVLQAFEYLHSRGIIYRDLKPENLMLDERGYVKLVDFGFAKYIGHSSKTWTFCGTPEYVAPEIILNKGHDRAVDYWALGILIHELLNGTPPFTANDPMKTYNIILKGIDMVDFPKHMSRSAIMLIKRLCRDVPAERLGYQKCGIQDIKKHKWFQGFDWDGLLNLTLIPPFLRPVSHSTDTSYFDSFPPDMEIPPNEVSGWDEEF